MPSAPDSFEAEVLALLPSLRRYSRSLARSDADGEDLLQDCVEKVLVRRGQWRGLNLRGWVLTIMTNLYRNGLRQQANRNYCRPRRTRETYCPRAQNSTADR